MSVGNPETTWDMPHLWWRGCRSNGDCARSVVSGKPSYVMTDGAKMMYMILSVVVFEQCRYNAGSLGRLSHSSMRTLMVITFFHRRFRSSLKKSDRMLTN